MISFIQSCIIINCTQHRLYARNVRIGKNYFHDTKFDIFSCDINHANNSDKIFISFPCVWSLLSVAYRIDGTKNLVDFVSREISEDAFKAFDARDICARYTCDSICSCTFGTDAQSFTSANPFFYEKGRQMLRGMANSLQSFIPIKMLPDEVEKFFIEIAREAIKCRMESKVQQEWTRLIWRSKREWATSMLQRIA